MPSSAECISFGNPGSRLKYIESIMCPVSVANVQTCVAPSKSDVKGYDWDRGVNRKRRTPVHREQVRAGLALGGSIIEQPPMLTRVMV